MASRMRPRAVSPSGSLPSIRLEVEVAHDLDERPVGDSVAVRQTAAFEHERVRAGGRDQLGGEAGLADARLADDRDDPAGAVGDGPLELRQQHVELGRTSDEGRVHPARHAGRVRLDVEQPPRVDGLGFPLQRQRRHRLCRDGVSDEADGRVADENLAGSRGGLEPLRDDDGVAGGERVALRRVAGEDLARVDAGAHADRDPVRRLELVVQARELAPELDCRPDRAERVVLVHDRDPEDTEDGVADELLDRAAVALEHLPRRVVIARPDAPERFRVELLAERGRVRNVAEDERDGLPDHEGECRAVSGPLLDFRPLLGNREEQELRERGGREVVVADEDQRAAAVGQVGPKVIPSTLSSGIPSTSRSSSSVFSTGWMLPSSVARLSKPLTSSAPGSATS